MVIYMTVKDNMWFLFQNFIPQVYVGLTSGRNW